MKRTKSVQILLAAVILLFLAADAMAIPAFARRYRISCSTCHAPFPKLKPYGDDFAGSGFILPEEERERDYVTAGDDLLWLNKTFPIAARFEAYGVQQEGNEEAETDLQVPWGMKLLSGGTLYKNIGYYFYFYMSEGGEVAGIEDAYVHFDNVFQTNLDIMVGQFQTSDPLMKRELRLTYEDYMIYKTRVGRSVTNLAYDRGVMLVYGVEKTGTDIIGMVVNGNGKANVGDDHAFDNDSFKNFGVRINQGIGDVASLGVYYYNGREESNLGIENEFYYVGPDVNIGVGPVELTGQYLLRRDSNPLFAQSSDEIETQGIVLEMIYSPKLDRSRFYWTALYNRVTSDLDDLNKAILSDHGVNPLAYHTATLSGTYELARNLRLLAEYTYDIEHESNRFVFGFVSAY